MNNSKSCKFGSLDNYSIGILNELTEGCTIIDNDLICTYINKSAAMQMNHSHTSLCGLHITEVFSNIEQSPIYYLLRKSMKTRLANRVEGELILGDGLRRWFSFSFEPIEGGVFILSSDITKAKQVEREKRVMFELMQLINQAETESDLLGSVLGYLQKWSGCEAIGIRIKDGLDYPYFQTIGFSNEFVKVENHLCSYDENGDIITDADGNPEVECMCGNILCGRYDPSKSFFTTDGCFWSNCTTELLRSTTDNDRQARTRNRCNGEGYESVALVPLRSGIETFGLLQFNDKRKNLFTEELINLYRRVADHIANFIAKKHAEAKVRHLNSVLLGIRNVNQLIIREKDRDHLIRKACSLLVDARGFLAVTICLTDVKNNEVLAYASAGEESTPLLQMLEHNILPECAREVMARREMITRSESPRLCDNCPGNSVGIKGWSETIIDLRHENFTYGFMSAYLPTDLEDDTSERRMLREISDDIAFALYGLQVEEQRNEAWRNVENIARFPTENPNPVMRIKPDGKLLYANAGAYRILKSAGAVNNSMIPDCLFRAFRGAIESASPTLVEIDIGERNFAFGVAPIKSEGYVNLYGHDITDLILTKRKLSDTEQQLLQSQKLDAIGQLAGGIAHDFNNLLTVQIGYCELMDKQLKLDEKSSKRLREIMRCAERAESLTRQLLAFSRKQTLQPTVFNLNTSVEDMEKMLRRIIGENIELVTELDADLGNIKADSGQIEQVIMNLSINARDAMSEGGRLSIRTSNLRLDEVRMCGNTRVEAGDYVLLTVSDTGCGIERNIQDKLFEPFFTTKEKGKGTGLGLSTVYGIVKQSGGSICVCSELGKGTTFELFLPRIYEGLSEVKVGKPVVAEGKGESILIVEDEDYLRELFVDMVESMGYNVTSAKNGQEALSIVEGQGVVPDLLITDVIMPVMNGATLVHKIGRTLPDVNVLFVSGYTDHIIADHGVLAPDTNFIQKPFKGKDLAEKIQSIISSQ